MTPMNSTASLPALLLLLVAIAPGAPPDPARSPSPKAAAEAAGRLRLPVWVDTEGAAPPAQPNFTVKLNGKPAKVLRVLDPSSDLVLTVVLDLTGELTGVEAARNALGTQANELRPNELLALLRAQDGLRVLLDPTTDRDAFRSALADASVGGKAALLDTVEPACALANGVIHKANVRSAVLFVTDSVVSNYRQDFTNPVINSSDGRDMSRVFPEGLVKERIAKLEASLLTTEAPLFIIHLTYASDRLGEAYQNGLKLLAADTGGGAEFCRTVAEIPDAMARIFEQIRSHWSILATVPGGVRRNVQVQVESEARVRAFRTRLTLTK
jgi:hypothetical protein